MRLIDADALDEKLEDLMIRYHALGRKRVVEDYNFVLTFLSTAPTIDAVEVVRCKDCTEHQRCKLEQRLGWYGYCSEGERREAT